MVLAIIIGLFSAAILLAAGYIFGTRRDSLAHSAVKDQLTQAQSEIARLNVNAETKMDVLLQQGDTLSKIVKPLAEWDSQLEKLDDAVKVMQDSASNNKGSSILTSKLTNLETSASHRSNLTSLMDEIVIKAGFEMALLSDDQGLPISGDSNMQDIDKFSALSAFILIFCDRFTRDGLVAPLSLLTHDADDREMLCRVFYIGEQRFVLTAISVGKMLTSDVLDPTLPKVADILSSTED
jgi:hypothetical protein